MKRTATVAVAGCWSCQSCDVEVVSSLVLIRVEKKVNVLLPFTVVDAAGDIAANCVQ